MSVTKITKFWVHVGMDAARNMADTRHNVLRYSLFYHWLLREVQGRHRGALARLCLFDCC
jgi:hypothetical protein